MGRPPAPVAIFVLGACLPGCPGGNAHCPLTDFQFAELDRHHSADRVRRSAPHTIIRIGSRLGLVDPRPRSVPNREGLRMRIAHILLLACAAARLFAEPVQYSSCTEVQRAIAGLPASGGVIELAPGTIACDGPLVIDIPNVTLRGSAPGTLFRLNDHVNAPVIVVGSIAATPATVVRNIVVRGIAIDGNKANQDRECSLEGCPAGSLRANGLTIRSAEDVWIDDVAVRDARSGGLVTELTCRRIRVSGFTSTSNHFDGIALYQTEDSDFNQLRLTGNGAAGISTDIQFRKNTFSRVTIAASGTVGVFMRDSSRNLFSDLHVEGSAQHALFLAQVDTDAATPATLNVFNGLRLENNQGAAIRINDASCRDNVVSSAVMLNNSGGCLSEAVDGITKTSATVCH